MKKFNTVLIGVIIVATILCIYYRRRRCDTSCGCTNCIAAITARIPTTPFVYYDGEEEQHCTLGHNIVLHVVGEDPADFPLTYSNEIDYSDDGQSAYTPTTDFQWRNEGFSNLAPVIDRVNYQPWGTRGAPVTYTQQPITASSLSA